MLPLPGQYTDVTMPEECVEICTVVLTDEFVQQMKKMSLEGKKASVHPPSPVSELPQTLPLERSETIALPSSSILQTQDGPAGWLLQSPIEKGNQFFKASQPEMLEPMGETPEEG